ncbi:MAG: hypothetical protein EOO03_04970 [Chitinophagaceae bacterium]|nr:MAG: hypothetical protein EOO03_04970 [Chitinophagaceae bacterium]
MTNKLSTLSRVLLVLGGLALLAVLYTPIWQIDLMAPQYPEGLKLLIYADKLAGNVDIINGLNHYIGMKTLHTDDFVEFKVLPGIIVFFALAFIAVGVMGKRRWTNVLLALFVTFGVLAMVDFWRWEYEYGHDLDPNAAIIVPGMAYQPPLIGFKQLLNFGAYSMPDTGGWIFVAVGMLLLAVVIFEWKKNKRSVPPGSLSILLIATLSFSLVSCSTSPQPIRLGQDACDQCKMTISDQRFAAEIVSTKGKAFKFDDSHCILAYLHSKKIAQQDVAGIYFNNFLAPHQFIKAGEAFFLQSPALKSPMNGNVAAFANEDSLLKMIPTFYGNKISWEDLQK